MKQRQFKKEPPNQAVFHFGLNMNGINFLKTKIRKAVIHQQNMISVFLMDMDINSILGYIWIYLYPLLLVSTIFIVLLNLIGFNLRRVYWFKIFSIVSVSFILGSFIYYIYQTYLISSSYTFFEVIKGFYDWAVFLTFYVTIISFAIMAIYYLYQKNKQMK